MSRKGRNRLVAIGLLALLLAPIVLAWPEVGVFEPDFDALFLPMAGAFALVLFLSRHLFRCVHCGAPPPFTFGGPQSAFCKICGRRRE